MKLLLDTNIIIDAKSAEILGYINCNEFSVSSVVLKEEVLKQVTNFNFSLLNIIKETYLELELAMTFYEINKGISFYDALNTAIAKERKFTLVTGDQKLIKFAKNIGVDCIGIIKLLELMIAESLISPLQCIEGLEKLLNDPSRRIPINLVNNFIEKIKDYYFIKEEIK